MKTVLQGQAILSIGEVCPRPETVPAAVHTKLVSNPLLGLGEHRLCDRGYCDPPLQMKKLRPQSVLPKISQVGS